MADMNQHPIDASAFQLSAPYPVPEALPASPRDARILASSFSGPVSELTAINQYIYHHLEMPPAHAAAARTLRGIAISEMRHLEMLGDCIRRLGARPEYRYYPGGSPRYWNARFVAYGRGAREMVELDLQGEHAAIKLYRVTIERIGNEAVAALLERIIEDERLHIQTLQNLLKTM